MLGFMIDYFRIAILTDIQIKLNTQPFLNQYVHYSLGQNVNIVLFFV